MARKSKRNLGGVELPGAAACINLLLVPFDNFQVHIDFYHGLVISLLPGLGHNERRYQLLGKFFSSCSLDLNFQAVLLPAQRIRQYFQGAPVSLTDGGERGQDEGGGCFGFYDDGILKVENNSVFGLGNAASDGSGHK
ncbi:MAG: hypothetical protein ACYCV0_01265 [Desulfitobacteriaceae bacterium]